MSTRTRTEWEQYAASLFGNSDTGEIQPLPAVNEDATQTDFGVRHESVATVVTTADIDELLPIPDLAVLQRSTVSSLRKVEQAATELLHHIQRELALQLQEAGVSYAPSTLDTLQDRGRYSEIDDSVRLQFESRRQLSFKNLGGADQVSVPASGSPEKKEYWSFVADSDKVELYPRTALSRAHAMKMVHDSVAKRHQVFDDIEQSLLQQAQTAELRLTSSNLRKPEQHTARYKLE